jgi:thiamine biosynthesis lipoprotein
VPSTVSNPKPQPSSSWRFEAIGTHWAIETSDVLSAEIKTKINERIDTFDSTYSRFRDDSLVSQIAKKSGTYDFPDDALGLVRLYRDLYDATQAKVTLLVGGSLNSLGYDKDYSLGKGKVTKPPGWDTVMQWDGTKLITTRPVTLDFGAAGKGYLVDEIAEILEQNSIQEYVIDGSGDSRHRGESTQAIGLENPYDSTMVIGVANLKNGSLCASASNRRKWGNGRHHIVDGKTGEPTNDVIATWVVADSTSLSDGIATALFFSSPDELKEVGSFEYVRMWVSGHVEHSEGFVGQLFI